MSLIKCPECGKEISDKSENCLNCGCPSSEWKKVTAESTVQSEYALYKNSLNEIMEEIVESYPENKIEMIKILRQKTGWGLKDASDAVEEYLREKEYEARRNSEKANGRSSSENLQSIMLSENERKQKGRTKWIIFVIILSLIAIVSTIAGVYLGTLFFGGLACFCFVSFLCKN